MSHDQAANPFAMLMDPQQYAEVALNSGRLSELRRRVYRPLDTPKPVRELSGAAANDALMDQEPDEVLVELSED